MDGAALKGLIDDFEALYERKYGKGSAYREAGDRDDPVPAQRQRETATPGYRTPCRSKGRTPATP